MPNLLDLRDLIADTTHPLAFEDADLIRVAQRHELALYAAAAELRDILAGRQQVPQGWAAETMRLRCLHAEEATGGGVLVPGEPIRANITIIDITGGLQPADQLLYAAVREDADFTAADFPGFAPSSGLVPEYEGAMFVAFATTLPNVTMMDVGAGPNQIVSFEQSAEFEGHGRTFYIWRSKRALPNLGGTTWVLR